MTKQQLIERVAQRLEKTQSAPKDGGELPKKTVALLVDTVFAELGDYFIKARVAERRGGKTPRFTYPGFGTFTKKEKRARAGRDPRSGEAIEIPARTTIAFCPGQEMKAELNRPRERVRIKAGRRA
jgi:nucleoid DNA-binding protein